MNLIDRIKDAWYKRQRRIQLEKAPTSLDEAVDRIIAQMSEEDKASYCKENPDHPGSQFHFFGGMAMRNNWGLWEQDTPLAQWFLSKGIFHADDRSAIIYKALYCRLNETAFDIEEEAKFYKAYWANTYGAESQVQIVQSGDGTWKVIQS